jgi:glyoxylase-like metal-dependent hydrolase (beta-lactamase superfamily II)
VLKYEKLTLGELETNCYVVWNEENKEGVVIDPADDGVEISQFLEERQIRLRAILATHGHFDHLLGGLDLKLIYDVPLYCHLADLFLLERQKESAEHFFKHKVKVPNFKKIDVDLNKISEIDIGGEKLEVIPLPGHTPGEVGFYYQKEGWLFDGDTLFAEGVGDYSHKYSSKEELKKSIDKIQNLPKGTLILPGHGPSFII